MTSIFRLLVFRVLPSLILSILTGVAMGQNSPSSQKIPDGPVVSLDTLFQTPNNPFPFDRFFQLRLSQPGKVEVAGFLVTPIGSNGIKKITRRDYHRFTWEMSENREDLKDFRKTNTWWGFKHPDRLTGQLLDQYVEYPLKNRTGIELKIPPLDPGRTYRISIVYKDQNEDDKFKPLIEPLANTFIGFSSVNFLKFKEVSDYYSYISKPNQSFKAIDLDDYILNLKFGDVLEINSSTRKEFDDFKSDRFQTNYNYKYIFSRNYLTENEALGLKAESFLEIDKDFLTDKVLAAHIFAMAKIDSLRDANGELVDFGSNGKSDYKLYLLINVVTQDLKKDSKIVFEDNLFVNLTNVTFIENQTPEIISWNPLSDPSQIQEEVLNSLIEFNSNRIKTEMSNAPIVDPKCLQVLQLIAKPCPCVEIGPYSEDELANIKSLIGLLYFPPENLTHNVLSGYSSLRNPNTLDTSRISTRLTNIESSLADVGSLETFANRSMTTSISGEEAQMLKSFVVFLRTLRVYLLENKAILDEDLKTVERFNKFNLDAWAYNSIVTVSDGSTQQIDFKAESKFKIVPDFGFVAIGSTPGEGVIRDILPYLGFNINFRNIDKNIPMRALRHKPWSYYLSFNAGITLTSIAIENKREDLFSGNSLMGGIGFRFNNYLKVIGGGVFFKKLSTNPLSNEKTLGVSPYLGLSIDFELRDLFGGINKLFQ